MDSFVVLLSCAITQNSFMRIYERRRCVLVDQLGWNTDTPTPNCKWQLAGKPAPVDFDDIRGLFPADFAVHEQSSQDSAWVRRDANIKPNFCVCFCKVPNVVTNSPWFFVCRAAAARKVHALDFPAKWWSYQMSGCWVFCLLIPLFFYLCMMNLLDYDSQSVLAQMLWRMRRYRLVLRLSVALECIVWKNSISIPHVRATGTYCRNTNI